MTTRWGFIGAGYIAKTALAPAVHNAQNASLYAVASRDAQRSQALGPIKVHNSYQDVIDDENVDAIYISLGNDQHITWTIAALKAGKHVLCEKPLALNAVQVQEMADTAKKYDRLLSEAVWTRWHPRFTRAVQAIKGGEIGELTSLDSSFTFTADLTGNYRLDPTMGGGALLDVGLYQVHLWQAFSQEPLAVTINELSRTLSQSGVDLTTDVRATIGGKTAAHAISSFQAPENQFIRATGNTGTLEFGQSQSFSSWREPSSLLINGKEEHFEAVDAYQLMIEAFSARIQGEERWVLPIESSLQVAQVLDQIAASPTITP